MQEKSLKAVVKLRLIAWVLEQSVQCLLAIWTRRFCGLPRCNRLWIKTQERKERKINIAKKEFRSNEMMNYNTNIQQQQIGRSSKYEVNVAKAAWSCPDRAGLAGSSWKIQKSSRLGTKKFQNELEEWKKKKKKSSLRREVLDESWMFGVEKSVNWKLSNPTRRKLLMAFPEKFSRQSR